MLHILLHLLLSTLFSFYIRGRKLYHAIFDRISAILNYHHRTPESMRHRAQIDQCSWRSLILPSHRTGCVQAPTTPQTSLRNPQPAARPKRCHTPPQPLGLSRPRHLRDRRLDRRSRHPYTLHLRALRYESTLPTHMHNSSHLTSQASSSPP